MTIVSFSEVWAFQTCPRSYYYKYVLNRTPLEDSEAITTGIDGHELLEVFYRSIQDGLSKEEAIAAVNSRARELQHDLGGNVTAKALKPWSLVQNYVEGLELKGSSPIVERAFVVPLIESRDLYVGFTPDLVWEYPSGLIDVEDYKFVGRAWPKRKLSRYVQLNLYELFLREMGVKVNKGVLRFFNTQTNEISKKFYTPTAEELRLLRAEFEKMAMDLQDYKDSTLATKQDRALRTINYTICQWCNFAFPCSLEAQGKDATKTLETEYRDTTYGYKLPF